MGHEEPVVVTIGGEAVEEAPPAFSLCSDNLERLEALAEAWGIPTECALNVVVSDAYDQKIAGMRDASGD